jgi:hypothetical protein
MLWPLPLSSPSSLDWAPAVAAQPLCNHGRSQTLLRLCAEAGRPQWQQNPLLILSRPVDSGRGAEPPVGSTKEHRQRSQYRAHRGGFRSLRQLNSPRKGATPSRAAFQGTRVRSWSGWERKTIPQSVAWFRHLHQQSPLALLWRCSCNTRDVPAVSLRPPPHPFRAAPKLRDMIHPLVMQPQTRCSTPPLPMQPKLGRSPLYWWNERAKWSRLRSGIFSALTMIVANQGS